MEIFYNILIEFDVRMKLVSLIKNSTEFIEVVGGGNIISQYLMLYIIKWYIIGE
jgi:hypothetical protein